MAEENVDAFKNKKNSFSVTSFRNKIQGTTYLNRFYFHFPDKEDVDDEGDDHQQLQEICDHNRSVMARLQRYTYEDRVAKRLRPLISWPS